MSNYFASELAENLVQRFVRDSSDMSMLEWICSNTTIRGRKFSVKGYEFQGAIINDMHPNLACRKCSQVGLTEAQIRKSLAWTYRNRGVSTIFTLPEEKLFKRVSQTRVKPIIDNDRVFQLNAEGAVRSMGIMQFGNSFLYLTGCTEGDATSTSADALFNDEVDLSDQKMLALFNSRLQNSVYKIMQRFSTPTFPLFGIDQDYQASDMHQYLCKCPSCGHHNNPTFDRDYIDIPGLPDHIEKLTEIEQSDIDDMDLLNATVVCKKCRSPLPLGDPETRSWVAEFPTRHARGYQVSPFATDRLNVAYIVDQLVRYKNRQFIRGFYNTVLGEPYSDGQIQLSREALKAAMKGGAGVVVGKDVPVSIGIDMGQTCHIVVGAAEEFAIFEFLAVPVEKLDEAIDELEAKYNVVAGGVDRFPYTPNADALRKKTHGRILPFAYADTGPFLREEKDKITEEVDHLKVNRTQILDMVANKIRKGQASFHGYSHQEEVIIEHLRDMWRDEQPEKPARWVKLTGQDHYFHALAFYYAGVEAKQFLKAKEKSDERTEVGVSLVSTSDVDYSQIFVQNSKRQTFNPGSIY